MKFSFLKATSLGFALVLSTQIGHSAALKKTDTPIQASVGIEKADKLIKPLSPIEKALSQQKRERYDSKAVLDNDQIKVMTTIQIAPTQNFFAEQHQRFSRFVQSIFSQHNS